jgi:hypothetical protein
MQPSSFIYTSKGSEDSLNRKKKPKSSRRKKNSFIVTIPQ